VRPFDLQKKKEERPADAMSWAPGCVPFFVRLKDDQRVQRCMDCMVDWGQHVEII
jgi:hypothetical protein